MNTHNHDFIRAARLLLIAATVAGLMALSGCETLKALHDFNQLGVDP